ncbi:isocitrate lyase 1 [Marasmius sp. AFHP31]|nr:isocitrate lyase 1 [Marasmius sp. AFHP31]
METKKPILAQAKDWDAAGLNEEDTEKYVWELGKLGFVWQFITLGLHSNGYISDLFAKEFSKTRMKARANYADNLIKTVTGSINLVQYPLTYTLMYSNAVIFGVFHCIPIMLNYRDFPGHTKDVHHLWIGYALLTTGLPLEIAIVRLFEVYWNANRGLAPVSVIFMACTCVFYPIAHIALMVLVVKQLSQLPPSALQQIEWTNWIPHLQGA